ncbi:MAG: glutathione S-transferase family protein [Immundisolibacteraceae bacterium]|nr:glutathione S-transferase family protein [Immundisolibacteraceae bacterium]
MLELYAFPLSGNSRKAALTLEEVGAEYEYHSIDLMQGGQKQPDYLAINPNGKVPTLRDGDHLLWESSAIMLYLAEKFPAAGLIPADPMRRAKLYQWLIWQPGTYNPPISALGQLLLTPMEQQDPNLIKQLHETIRKNSEIIETQLGKRSFLLDDFSLADIVMLPHLNAAVERKVELSANMHAYLQRLQNRPSWKKVSSMTP